VSWSCVLVTVTGAMVSVYDPGASRWRPLSDIGEWGPYIDDMDGAEIASLRAFVSEVADLLGCEADEPGALESMIVELSAMRDRDEDGAIEIANLRAEVERLTAERDACRRILDAALALGEDALP